MIWNIWTKKLLMRIKNHCFDFSIGFHKFSAIGSDQYGNLRPIRRLKCFSFEWNIINSPFWNIGTSMFQCKEQNCQKFFAWQCYGVDKNVSTTEKILVTTLIEERKPLVKGDNWGWVWMSGNINIGGYFFRKVWTIKILMQQKDRLLFTSILLYKCFFLNWGFDGGNQICSSWELNNGISSENKMNSLFWSIWTVTNPMHGSKQKVC